MPTENREKEKVLVLVDPVSCGTPALERALEELQPDRHDPTVLVVAKAPPADDREDREFAYSDSALATYLRAAEANGFHAQGWVTPDRREQIAREIEATGPYTRALAVSPSGTWRRLVKKDVSRLLETAGIETSLHCSR